MHRSTLTSPSQATRAALAQTGVSNSQRGAAQSEKQLDPCEQHCHVPIDSKAALSLARSFECGVRIHVRTSFNPVNRETWSEVICEFRLDSKEEVRKRPQAFFVLQSARQYEQQVFDSASQLHASSTFETGRRTCRLSDKKSLRRPWGCILKWRNRCFCLDSGSKPFVGWEQSTSWDVG